MALQREQIGNRVFIVDRDNKLIFTITEVKKAQKRFDREASRELRQRIRK